MHFICHHKLSIAARTWLECSQNVPNCSLGIMLLYPWPHHSLHQLIKHNRLHPEVLEERLRVFYCELLHQSVVMSIQSPPLLCQP